MRGSALSVVLVASWGIASWGIVGQAVAGPITLVPPALNPGDVYHLAFVSTTQRDALSDQIADYDAHVQSAADAAGIGVGSSLGDITWLALGSTAPSGSDTDAITHLNISGPVFMLDGTQIATGSVDLWDGSIAVPLGIDEFGDPGGPAPVWTGTLTSGFADVGTSLGDNSVTNGRRSQSGNFWVDINAGGSTSLGRRFYAFSTLLTAPDSTDGGGGGGSGVLAPEPSTMLLWLIVAAAGFAVRAGWHRGRKPRG